MCFPSFPPALSVITMSRLSTQAMDIYTSPKLFRSVTPMGTATSLFFCPLCNNTNNLLLPLISTKTPKPFLSSSNLSSNSITTSCSSTTNSATSADSSIQSSPTEPLSVVKVPTAPWMRGPLHVEPTEILDLTKSGSSKNGDSGKIKTNPDEDLSGRMGPGRGKREMKKIFGGIKSLQKNKSKEDAPPKMGKFKFPDGGLWGDGNFDQELLLENESEFGEIQNGMEHILFEVFGKGKSGRKSPWNVDDKMLIGKMKKEKVPTAAELSLDKPLLYRLRDQAQGINKWVKVKKAGITQAVVDEICLIWKSNELAMVKFDIPLSRNMDRAREIVEMKTRGLVVWKKKDVLVIYRGNNHNKNGNVSSVSHGNSTFHGSCQDSSVNNSPGCIVEGTVDEVNNPIFNSSLYEKEGDRLLDGLGPRFVDWWMHKPLPVDADLLPETIRGFKTPFRLCPPRGRSQLLDNELTYLRKLAQSLPTHFVLGRNRKLQGLASSIIKLWEKCHLAKIAIKWGVQNTDNKQMADELKYLTGGVLLLRNKFFIILYRGKDFIPPQIAEMVSKRESELGSYLRLEETVRVNASEELTFSEASPSSDKSSIVGTLSEFHDIVKEPNSVKSEMEVQLEAQKSKLEKELRNHQRAFCILKNKIKKSETRLMELDSAWTPKEQDADQETVTTEERECLRQIGLKIEATIVLGRRGVFKGVIESLHQHWKHREIVKVVTMQRLFSQVEYTAKALEGESGGILISIEKLKEGHAIILFRGKNYKRPIFSETNLLDKREALFRSLELQRIGSLKFFTKQKEQRIADLRRELEELPSIRSYIFGSP